jgi:long-subunit fatty acid transport protein
MKKTKIILFFLLVLCFIPEILSAQTDGPREKGDLLTNPGWEFYSDNTLSSVSAGKGYTGIASLGDLSSLSLNPASVNIDKKFQAYIGYNYKTKFKLYNVNLDNDMENVSPSFFVGSVYKINKDIQVGIVYRNEYSFKFISQLSGGDEISYSLVTHSFTVPINYNYKWLRAGVNLNLTYFRGEAKGITTEFYPEGFEDSHSSLWRFIPQFGVQISPVPFLSFGATYTPGFTDSTSWYIGDTNARLLNASVKYPDRFGIGAELRLLKNRLKLSLDYHYDKTSVLSQLKDKSNINIGVEYCSNNNFIIRGGFYTLNDFRDLSATVVTETYNYNLYFLTIGGTYKYKCCTFNLALMDSHLLNKSDVAHTKINGGISLDF